MKPQLLFLLCFVGVSLAVAWQIVSPQLPIDTRRVERELGKVALRLHYPVALITFVTAAIKYTPEAFAPFLHQYSREICRGWGGFSMWEFIVRWGGVLFVIPMTRYAYQAYRKISDIRRTHWHIYARFSEIITIYGNWFSDLLWAYFQALLIFTTTLAMMSGVYIAIALYLECHWIVIFITYLLLAALPLAAWQLSLTIITEMTRPRRLETEVRDAARIVPELEKCLIEYKRAQAQEHRDNDSEVREDVW